MLEINNIKKQYTTSDLTQIALNDVNLSFRNSEFVAILGPSGSGKTTLLNIIGGLDRYETGDLIINGISTKEYKDRDWDAYRNHTIGFVFQSYNLIPHQSILSNVELALTISGISKEERKKRAKAALDEVELSGQYHKRPNQMSGGQMQRVAIARALVNNPNILLADEPTGALDSETSVHIMNLLKEVAKDRLVIMVTHNSEIADQYANRIVKLRDGKVIDDSNPYEAKSLEVMNQKMGRAKMSFFTALSLSLNNLMTKKARTFLTSFAGSIGIIGIALILSLSNGMQNYIKDIQEDTLSTYPIAIQSESMDISGMMSVMMNSNKVDREGRDPNIIYSSNIMNDMIKSLSTQLTKNDLNKFKAYIDSNDGKKITDLAHTIQYGYGVDLQIYKSDTSNEMIQVNPNNLFSKMMGIDTMFDVGGGMSNMSSKSMGIMQTDNWAEMIDNKELLRKQYDILAGSWPSEYNEVVFIVDEHNELSDAVLYSLGILDQNQLIDIKDKIRRGETMDNLGISQYTYDDLMNMTFKLVVNTEVYEKENGLWIDKSDRDSFMKSVINNGLDLKVVGILRPNPEVKSNSINGSIAYNSDLTLYVIDKINDSEIVKEQKADINTNVLTGMPFDMKSYTKNLTMKDVNFYISTLPVTQQDHLNSKFKGMSEPQILEAFADMMKDNAGGETTYESNLKNFGVVDLNNPNFINIYPKDFQTKDRIGEYIDEYNDQQRNEGHEEYEISHPDIMAIMMSSVTSIINIVTYVLVAFVAISLVVSSIMIAIITYISVLERTKEIGILRSIGASKRDISRVFNAETIIEGLVSGVLGIVITLLLNLPIDMAIKAITNISGIATLPLTGGIVLILLSVILTVIAGLIPAKIAAKKDPVVALRTD